MMSKKKIIPSIKRGFSRVKKRINKYVDEAPQRRSEEIDRLRQKAEIEKYKSEIRMYQHKHNYDKNKKKNKKNTNWLTNNNNGWL